MFDSDTTSRCSSNIINDTTTILLMVMCTNLYNYIYDFIFIYRKEKKGIASKKIPVRIDISFWFFRNTCTIYQLKLWLMCWCDSKITGEYVPNWYFSNEVIYHIVQTTKNKQTNKQTNKQQQKFIQKLKRK